MAAISIWHWAGFLAFVIVMLALDLGVFHREAHQVSVREAAAWSVLWVSLALLFNAGIHYYLGARPALEFFTGYLIEKSLSVDNIFIFLVIFRYFAVPAAYQHRVLFWGILGALILRGVMIGGGVALVSRFHWVIYLFGAFLVFTAVRLFLEQEEAYDPSTNPVVRFARRFFPVTDRYDGQRFFTWEGGRRLATPLFLVLLVVESTDVVFAVDSIPAIFAITLDPFIVFTSNIFAILGLRSFYFLLAGIIDRFRYLKVGLSAVLAFVGVKMLLVDLVHIPIGISLAVVASVLTVTVVMSLVATRRDGGHSPTGSPGA